MFLEGERQCNESCQGRNITSFSDIFFSIFSNVTFFSGTSCAVVAVDGFVSPLIIAVFNPVSKVFKNCVRVTKVSVECRKTKTKRYSQLSR